MAKSRKPTPAPIEAPAPTPEPTTKLDQVIAALKRPKGATIPDLVDLTGWQEKSVRGFLSGALKKKRGLNIVSTKAAGMRSYRIEERQA